MYEVGDGVEINLILSDELKEKACSSPLLSECIGTLRNPFNLSRQTGTLIKDNQNYTLRECEINDSDRCIFLAISHFFDDDFLDNDSISVLLLKQSCDFKNGSACYILSLLYSNGLHIDHDPTQSQKFFRLSCALGVTTACPRIPFGSPHEEPSVTP